MRRILTLAILAALGIGIGLERPTEGAFIRVVAQLTPTADFPVGTFFVVQRTTLPSGQNLFRSTSSNGVSFLDGQIDAIVDTFIQDVPASSYTGQWAFFMGAYGGTYEFPEDTMTIPPVEPLTPHTGLITSLPFDPAPGSTFESIWGVDEATILAAYQQYVYHFPGIFATPEERAAWQQSVDPLLNMIYGNPQLLLPWKPQGGGNFSMNGRLIRFSDPQDIGSIRGGFQSSFVSAVPEPSSLLMAGLGGAGLAGLVWSRRRLAGSVGR